MPNPPPKSSDAAWLLGPGHAALVSVIVPTYNRRDLLAETLASVKAQTYPRVETVVVDDGGTDDTAALLAEEGWARCLRQEHGGAQRARNQGVLGSSGEFIQFLDSDDLLPPGKLAEQAQYLADHPEADAVYGEAVGFVDPDPRAIRYRLRGAPRDKLQFHLRGHRLLAHISSVLWRRTAVERIGPWDERLSRWQDWDYLLRALVLDLALVHAGRACSVFRVGRPGSITTTPYSDATSDTLLYAFAKSQRLLREHGKDSPRNLGALFARGLDTANDLLTNGCAEAAAELVAGLRRVSAERRVSGALTRWFLRRWTPERPGLHRLWRLLALGQYGLQRIAMGLEIA